MVVGQRLDLRGRIALLVLAALVPALLIGLVAGLRERGQRIAEVSQQVQRLARLISSAHAQQVEATRYLLQTAALVPEVQRGDARACAALLRELGRRFPRYTSLLMTDADGLVLATSHEHVPDGLRIADRPYFQRLQAGESFTVGEYAVGRITGRPTLHCAVAMRDPSGRLTGAVVAGIDLAWVGEVARSTGLHAGSVVTLVDRGQTILARSLEPNLVGTALPDSLAAHLAVGPEGVFRSLGLDGVDRIYGHIAMGGPEGMLIGRVVVGVPTGPVMEAADRGLFTDLLLVLALAGLAVVAARLLAQRLIEVPVRRLVGVTGRLAGGDLLARTSGFTGQGEFAVLAQAVDAMAESLARREAGRLADAEEIRRTRVLLGAIIDAAPLAVFLLDGFGVVRSVWSRGAEEMFGWTAEEVLDRLPPHVPPERRSECFEHRRRLANGEVLSGIEVERRRKDGTDIRVEVHAAPLRDEAGRCSGSVWMLADVTAQRTLQEQLQQAQKIELVGRLAGGVAHDFNNLLAVITGYSDLLARRIEDPVQRQQVEQIAGAAQRAAALTGRLLGFARRRPLAPQVIDLAVQAEDSARLMTRVVGDRIELTTACRGPCPVLADPVQIDQILMNLVINARDAIADGGAIVIGVAMHGSGDQARVELTVRDTGAGMSRAVQAHLFEPFFTTKPPGKGTGLGLSTVRAIVTDLGGVITVESVEGHGSRFQIVLPAATAGTASRRHRSPLPVPSSALVVDDDPAVLAVMEAALAELGIAIRAVAVPAEAIAMLDDGFVPDMLVTDLVMPDMDGATLARAARTRIAGLRVLVVSGYADERLTRAVAELGPRTAMLGKPFSGQRLTDAVRALMGKDE